MATIKDLNLLLNILNEGAVFSAESRQFQIFTPQNSDTWRAVLYNENDMKITMLSCTMRMTWRLQCCLVQWEWHEDYNAILYNENEYYNY